MFAHATNFAIHQSVFSTGTVNVTYQVPSQTVNQGRRTTEYHLENAEFHTQLAGITDVLQCPSPSQYFVGREDTLRQLAKIFYPPIVSIWGSKLHKLRNFVRQEFQQ